MQITKYFASLGIEIDKASVKQVDKVLNSIEAKIKSFGQKTSKGFKLEISGFDINQTALNVAVGNALDIASARNVLDVSRFHIDKSHLNTAMASALREASLFASRSSTLRPSVRVNPVGGAENALRPRHVTGAAVGGGLIGRGLSGIYGPALTLGFGGYGLSQLNKRNQQVVSAQLQTSAVVQQALGENYTPEAGTRTFDWLKSQGQRVGFNYLEAAPDFAKLLSGLTGAGMSVQQGQGVYKGFAELSRVNKLDRTQQQRVFRALSQIAGKNKLQSEELTGQLAESLPGAVSLFARAYQQQKGGSKTGQEAITELLAAMKKGQVKGDILVNAGNLASEQAKPGLTAASQASQAEQARYQNTVSDLAIVASNNGVEEGFARIFRTLSAGLSESNDLVKILAEGFNDVTKWADDLLLWPQSFVRALEGRDSLVADWLGKDATAQLQKDWNSIKESMTTIGSIGAPSWLPSLQTVSKDIAAQFQIIAALSNGDLSGVGEGLKNFVVGRAKSYGNAVVSGPNLALRAAGELFDTPTPQLSTDGLSFYAPKSTLNTFGLTKQLLSVDPLTGEPLPKYDIFSDSPLGPQYDSNVFGQKLAGLESLTPEERYNARNSTRSLDEFPFSLPTLETTPSGGPFQDLSQPPVRTPADLASQNRDAALAQSAQTVTNTTTNQFDITISVDATLAGVEIEQQARAMADALSAQITGAFEQVQVNYPTTR